MNKYESVIIINPDLNEKQIKETIENIQNLIKGFSDNNNLETEELGLKKLAYEIKKHNTGYYVVFNFQCNENDIYELERRYRIKDEIIKFIVIRKED